MSFTSTRRIVAGERPAKQIAAQRERRSIHRPCNRSATNYDTMKISHASPTGNIRTQVALHHGGVVRLTETRASSGEVAFTIMRLRLIGGGVSRDALELTVDEAIGLAELLTAEFAAGRSAA